jgi:integrase/recombinase XerD
MPDPDLRALLESRPTVAAFIAELLNDGREAATARARQLALRRFAWLAEEGELDADPLAGLKPPKLDSKVVPVLSDQQLRAVLAACQGPALIPAHHPRTAGARLPGQSSVRPRPPAMR